MHKPRPRPQDFPDSPYALELFGDLNALRFARALETQYRATHLARVKKRVQLYFAVAIAAVLVLTEEQALAVGWANSYSLWNALILVPSAAIMLGMTLSPHYPDWHRRIGLASVGVFNVMLAVLIAHGLLRGSFEDLAVLTVGLMAVFFFSGLLFRQAVLIAALTLAAFALAAVMIGMPGGELLKSLIVTGMTTVVAGVIYHDAELGFRVGFLEAALLDDLIARDGLSGLMNRHAFDDHLDRVWKQALRDRRSITVFMIDIDHFTRFNDAAGRDAGDEALRSVAQAIHDFGRRPLDLAARYQGAQFSIVLYDLAPGHVSDMAERLRYHISAMQIGALTVSIGVSLAVPALGRTPEDLVRLAAEALQEAKRAGRNRVVFKGEHSFAPLQTGTYKIPRAGRLARTG